MRRDVQGLTELLTATRPMTRVSAALALGVWVPEIQIRAISD
jgi:hypothetical protein